MRYTQTAGFARIYAETQSAFFIYILMYLHTKKVVCMHTHVCDSFEWFSILDNLFVSHKLFFLFPMSFAHAKNRLKNRSTNGYSIKRRGNERWTKRRPKRHFEQRKRTSKIFRSYDSKSEQSISSERWLRQRMNGINTQHSDFNGKWATFWLPDYQKTHSTFDKSLLSSVDRCSKFDWDICCEHFTGFLRRTRGQVDYFMTGWIKVY